jgi:hypothetical protein
MAKALRKKGEKGAGEQFALSHHYCKKYDLDANGWRLELWK